MVYYYEFIKKILYLIFTVFKNIKLFYKTLKFCNKIQQTYFYNLEVLKILIKKCLKHLRLTRKSLFLGQSFNIASL